MGRRTQSSHSSSVITIVSMAGICFLVFSPAFYNIANSDTTYLHRRAYTPSEILNKKGSKIDITRHHHARSLFDDAITKTNSQLIHEWRREYINQCITNETTSTTMMKNGTNEKKDDRIEKLLHNLFHPSKSSYKESNDTDYIIDEIIPCDYTFLDLGANIGDSLGKLIDSGIPDLDCPINSHNSLGEYPKYNLDDGLVNEYHHEKRVGHNKLVRFCRRFMTENDQDNNNLNALDDDNNNQQQQEQHQQRLYPEQLCYYGVEGNPAFTQRLRELEHRVMGSYPRPVRRAHFLTESVAAGTDGPTVLYLDAINERHNFWGSSLLSSHPDVVQSAQTNSESKGQLIKAYVMGYTLTTLIEKTVNKQRGAKLFMKMDIEGGEFIVLNEAYDSGIFCRYVHDYGVSIYLLLEVHNQFRSDPNSDFKRFTEEVRPKFEKECGITTWIGLDAGR